MRFLTQEACPIFCGVVLALLEKDLSAKLKRGAPLIEEKSGIGLPMWSVSAKQPVEGGDNPPLFSL
jgi:hypothetical protein